MADASTPSPTHPPDPPPGVRRLAPTPRRTSSSASSTPTSSASSARAWPAHFALGGGGNGRKSPAAQVARAPVSARRRRTLQEHVAARPRSVRFASPAPMLHDVVPWAQSSHGRVQQGNTAGIAHCLLTSPSGTSDVAKYAHAHLLSPSRSDTCSVQVLPCVDRLTPRPTSCRCASHQQRQTRLQPRPRPFCTLAKGAEQVDG